MTSFSQLVDRIALETRRPDLVPEITEYLNQTIRELHFTPKEGSAILYRDNLVELQLTAGQETGFTWTIPNPSVFQAMSVIRYDTVYTDNKLTYPPEMTPSRALAGMTRFYYRAGRTYAFAGYGGVGGIVSLAYYEYPRQLKYKAFADRPASWDEEAGWTYSTAANVSDATRAAALLITTNWLLDRWDIVMAEGLRAKVYKRLSETDRARTCYSLYTTLRQGLYTSEVADLGGYQ